MAKMISLFNHKGGVSKTTTAFNLGWKMSEMGKKVLVVDLDSQCNLTGLILGLDSTDDDFVAGFYSNRDNLSMQQIVSSLINGDNADNFVSSERGKFYPVNGNKNLFLLAGDLSVSDLDSQISVSLKIAAGVPATKNIPGNLTKIIRLLADRGGMDYVICDLSPNVGGLNEVVLMSSDYFIVPTFPDFFCLQAVGSLAKNLKKWQREITRFKEDIGFGEDRLYPIHNQPCFIGSIQQRYRPRKGKPARSFEKWIEKIGEAVNGKLVPVLKELDGCCILSEQKMLNVLEGTGLLPYDLAHVPDFNSLIAVSQELSKPVFSITDGELSERFFGDALRTLKESRDKFLDIFSGLAERVLKATI